VPSLSAAEASAREALLARMQRLPEGIAAVVPSRRLVGCCDVCGEETEWDDNLLLECDG
jgi:hypothetical protein